MSDNLYDLGGGILFQRKLKDVFTLLNISFNNKRLRLPLLTANFVIIVCFQITRNMNFYLNNQHIMFTMNMNYEYKLYLNLDILSGNSKRLCCKSTRETKVSSVNF